MATATKAPPADDAYIPVSVSMLMPSKLCGVALYERLGTSSTMRLFLGADLPVTQEKLLALTQSGCRKLYVLAGDHRRFQNYLRDNLAEALQDESRGIKQRFDMLNLVVRDVLGEAFASGNVKETVGKTKELGETTVDLLCREGAVAKDLCGVLCHDYHTFTHSANVAYYCVMLAKELGITSRDELNKIASGGLLHDLGKLRIPDTILTKPGKLTDAEFAVVKMHPTYGFRALCQRDDLTLGQLMMVYQHHERLDGSGYPTQCGGDEIHPWARICAVCDVFEALTSHRPYRAGMSFGEAFKIMERKRGADFDEEIYACWKQLIASN